MDIPNNLASVHLNNSSISTNNLNKSRSKNLKTTISGKVVAKNTSSVNTHSVIQDILQDQHNSLLELDSYFDNNSATKVRAKDSQKSNLDPVYLECKDFQMQNPQRFLRLLKCPEGLEYLKELDYIKVNLV